MQSKDEFASRAAQLLMEESQEPLQWLWLSFADEDGFKGCVILEERGIITAVMKCNQLQINPGGEVVCTPIPEEYMMRVPEEARTRLLSLEEMRKYFGELSTLDGKTV